MFVMGTLVVATSAQAAAEAPKPAMAKKEAAKDIVLKNDAKCTTCHDEADSPELLAIGKTKHGTRADKRTPECTSCHGESEKHVNHKGSDKPPKVDRSFAKGPGRSSAEVRNEACTTCHKGGTHMFWATSTHSANDVACSDCHQVHKGGDKVRDKRTQAEVCYTCHKQQRAEMSKPSRHPVREGKMSCSDCHSPHGSPGQKQLTRGTVNETCYTCHMEKRGPFLNNHQPVSEDCGICHNPHGTTVANLLKSRPPFLCQECHEGAQHPSSSSPGGLPVATNAAGVGPGGRGVMAAVGRGCVNCHTNIHGSNNPANTGTSGDRLTR
ncbi:MAG: DmsE family decaheme c-type cytochrome [Betaproteobacteria bacterium]|nr:DmsE family decaheme c-type cytochrome [Betaproteobacteria bacterium]